MRNVNTVMLRPPVDIILRVDHIHLLHELVKQLIEPLVLVDLQDLMTLEEDLLEKQHALLFKILRPIEHVGHVLDVPRLIQIHLDH